MEQRAFESNVLALVHQHRVQRLVAAEVAQRFGISARVAEQMLDRMVAEGRLELDSDDDGNLFYFLPGNGAGGVFHQGASMDVPPTGPAGNTPNPGPAGPWGAAPAGQQPDPRGPAPVGYSPASYGGPQPPPQRGPYPGAMPAGPWQQPVGTPAGPWQQQGWPQGGSPAHPAMQQGQAGPGAAGPGAPWGQPTQYPQGPGAHPQGWAQAQPNWSQQHPAGYAPQPYGQPGYGAAPNTADAYPQASFGQQPAYGQQAYGQPGYGQPQYGQAQYGAHPYPQPSGYQPPSYAAGALVQTHNVDQERRSPGVAAMLSLFFPGAGQLYNGEVGKGITFFFLSIVLLLGAFPFGLIPWIWSMVDAHETSRRMNAQLGMLPP